MIVSGDVCQTSVGKINKGIPDSSRFDCSVGESVVDITQSMATRFPSLKKSFISLTVDGFPDVRIAILFIMIAIGGSNV